MRSEERAFLENVNTEYSYSLAKQMEQFKTNQVLGYRTAGSTAEIQTGDMIKKEMESIGLQKVRKDEISLDTWEFETAILRYRDETDVLHEYQLGAYQTDFHTDGFREFSMVYAGRGTATDYEGLDVTGKLVLVQINQREEWWINFPVYEAHLHGAAALIAVQEGGFGQIDDKALNAQDIGGPADAPAFSMSRFDAQLLKEALLISGAIQVEFCAESTVKPGGISYNIVGEIPGIDSESMILLSAHYDSYFSGFQDDNAAIGMMLGIGSALIKSGYYPQKTILFCALAAEEWGIADCKYDWSTGAWQQVSKVHPEWQGKIVADLNFELPALSHGEKDGIRSVYEYASFLENFIQEIEVNPEAYPKGIAVHYPIQTMSDDFSMAIAGIPSMVNDFTAGSFMETHYHSQFDSEVYYEEPVYRFHHELYGRLVMAYDRTVIAPLDFERLFLAIKKSLNSDFTIQVGANDGRLRELTEEAAVLGQSVWLKIQEINKTYASLLDSQDVEGARCFRKRYSDVEISLMRAFRKGQDSFVRLNWHDEVLFPHEATRENLRHICQARQCLEIGDVPGALEAIYQIDNNRYAFQFTEEVFDHFTNYVMNQENGRLQWGAGRIIHHENLFRLVQMLKKKAKERNPKLEDEKKILKVVEQNQRACYIDDIEYMIHAIEKIIQNLKETYET